MAIIQCPECGKEVSDTAKACPNCGYPIKQKIKQKQENEKQKFRQEKKVELKQKRKENFQKIKPIHIINVVIVVIVIVTIVLFANKNIDYKNAVKTYEAGDYKSAYEYFKKSNYRDSIEYREKTIIEYAKLLIKEKEFESADQMLNLITDKTIYLELQKEMTYIRSVEAYEAGAFELSYKLLQNIKEYKDAETYLKNAEMMMNIQGEWNLSGSLIPFWGSVKEINFAALNIEGWRATLLYCTDLSMKYEEVGSCKLNMINTAEVSLKIDTIEYIITSKYSGDGQMILVALVINDDFLNEFDINYIWNNYSGNRETLCFFKTDSGIPKQPTIGMKADEVEQSTWGSPNKINKTTYSWGVKEQWCYPSSKYIYLEDGIVVAISE